MSSSYRSSNHDSYRSDRGYRHEDSNSNRKRSPSLSRSPRRRSRDRKRSRSFSRSRSRSPERDQRRRINESKSLTGNDRYRNDRPNQTNYRRDDDRNEGNRRNQNHDHSNRGRGNRNFGHKRDKFGGDYPVNEILVESSIQRPKFDWSTALLPSGKLEDGEEAEMIARQTVDEPYDDNAMKELDKFIQSVGGGEEDNDDEESAEDDDSTLSMTEEEKILEESRRRREEIMKKYQHSHMTQSSIISDTMEMSVESGPSITNDEKAMESSSVTAAAVDDDDDDMIPLFNRMRSSSNSDNVIEVNPDTAMDIYNDQAALLEAERQAVEAEANNQRGKVFDMFSSSPSDFIQPMLMPANGTKLSSSVLDVENKHLQSNWDDSEGYYKARIGEIIADRYRTLGIVGKGVFSTVLKCLDLRSDKRSVDDDQPMEAVAIKLIRNNDVMKKAAEKERLILQSIRARDPENKKHCVKLHAFFEYRNHIAFVFEYQAMNLREALKKFGKDVGINIGAVRLYGKQLFIALKLLSDLQFVHADIKLDNILCSEDLRQVKLCDFGSGFHLDDPDNVPTPYLVSRFYRAPEIMLGLQYDTAIDLWSVCVSLYELFTGHVMFPGRTNNDMLRLIMQVKGKFSNKIIKVSSCLFIVCAYR
jgi:serine/threonine-protein kinase PRP4